MGSEQADSAALQQRLRQEALLKEYEIINQDATSTANWIWLSTTVVLVTLMSGLGLVAADVASEGQKTSRQLVWSFAIGACAVLFVWMAFLARNFQLRERLFVRQRQIEEELGLLKSTAIETHDRWASITNPLERLNLLQTVMGRLGGVQQRQALGRFIADSDELSARQLTFERLLLGSLGRFLVTLELGRAGRAALYAIAFLVMDGWVTVAISSTWKDQELWLAPTAFSGLLACLILVGLAFNWLAKRK